MSDEAAIAPACLSCEWRDMCRFWQGDGGRQCSLVPDAPHHNPLAHETVKLYNLAHCAAPPLRDP